MSTTTTPSPLAPGQLPAYVERASANVQTDQLDPVLLRALTILGHLHMFLFDAPLVVTSGNDGEHVKTSKHYTNQAVDIRSRDKPFDGQLLFAAVVIYVCYRLGIKVFDERARKLAPHWHLELA